MHQEHLPRIAVLEARAVEELALSVINRPVDAEAVCFHVVHELRRERVAVVEDSQAADGVGVLIAQGGPELGVREQNPRR